MNRLKQFSKFFVPSLIGAVTFLFPIRYEGNITILMAALSDGLLKILGDKAPIIVLVIITISAVTSLWYSLKNHRLKDVPSNAKRLKPHEAKGFLDDIFIVNHGWLFIRVLGFVITVLIFFEIGPHQIYSELTGGVVLYSLATAIVTIFFIASFLMPLLTDYGLMEFLGTILSKLFRFLFRLPGRSCIDALASWMAAAPVGVLITIQQFEKGNYSMRESAVIATNFSVVSVPFCVIVIQTAGLEHLFVEYYLTVVVTGLVAAIITPRIPPLSRIPDHYSEKGRQLFEDSNPQEGLWSNGFNAALQKSQEAPGLRQLLKNAIRNLFDIWFGLLPSLVAIGTIGLVLAEFTPLLRWLSLPLIPLLNLFQLPEANLAAPALLAGFADMFLPAVLVKNISSEITRFVVATVSITQLIYMTEIGVLILRSRIPLNILNLIQIFLIRMLISLPIVIISARLFVF